jgi:Na+-translocating ferredoxin:NAD+ oxidoreductase RnfD subunit
MWHQHPGDSASAAVLASGASARVSAGPALAPPALRGRRKWLGIVMPSRSDPRLKLSVTIVVLTIFGQTILRFDVSLTQIAVAVAICAGADLVMTYRQRKEYIWPASGIQTGLSIGYIFRANGTPHGALWSTHGLQFFVVVSAAAMLSKYLIRGKRHIFNPSNFGIALGLLVFSPAQVFSEHLWWGPPGVRLGVTVAVIACGGYWVLRQVKMLTMAAAFLATFAVVTAVFALLGRGYLAVWHSGAVTGIFYWETLAISPEVMIFALFMISDPQTAPKTRLARIVYGVLIALLAGALIYPQSTEFGIKAALVAALLASCALVPATEFACANGARTLARARAALSCWFTWRGSTGWRVLAGAATAVLVLALGTAAVVRTVSLAHDPAVVRIDGGQPPGGSTGPAETGFGGDLQD